MATAVVTQQSSPATVPKVKSGSKANNTTAKSPGPHSTVQVSPMSATKFKKDALKPTATPPTMSAPTKGENREQLKKVSRRTSKPFIDWFQRKLAGTVRARRTSDSRYSITSSNRSADKQHRRSSVPAPPPLSIQSRTRSNTTNRAHSLRGTISLNETNDDADSHSFRSDSSDEVRSSGVRESLYSPASYLEADEDASVRPLPPSSPPSPAPSRDSSSYLSHSRTFRSMTASTKPTTVLSIDLNGGMAHIAQAPPTPTTPGHRLPPHIRTHSSGPSAGSITFSAIPPPSPTSPSRPSSGNSGAGAGRGATLSAPLYTTHHPRNNPRPSSPPPDDASVLTLASSAFGMPGARVGGAAFGLSGRASVADDAISQWSNTQGLTDSTSHFMMGDLEEGLGEERYDHDVDASVRALRPRSSRRGSWDSTVSGWSANVAVGAPSPGGARSKSVWTSGSLITGGLSTDEILEESVAGAQETEGARKNLDEESRPTTNQMDDTAVENAQTPPAVNADIQASTVSLPGSKASVPVELASTGVLPGSKAASEVPSPFHALENEHRSGASTPTKDRSDAAFELSDATAQLELEETPLSPSSTAHSEYVSAPSTPAVV
ncbi:hypothetical protein C8Q74DRAFT_1201281 [Fomes fomentarius]|nr:hypothetical protein C8Q74DRAFT_1201281 [Fomes fomentarius]